MRKRSVTPPPPPVPPPCVREPNSDSSPPPLLSPFTAHANVRRKPPSDVISIECVLYRMCAYIVGNDRATCSDRPGPRIRTSEARTSTSEVEGILLCLLRIGACQRNKTALNEAGSPPADRHPHAPAAAVHLLPPGATERCALLQSANSALFPIFADSRTHACTRRKVLSPSRAAARGTRTCGGERDVDALIRARRERPSD